MTHSHVKMVEIVPLMQQTPTVINVAVSMDLLVICVRYILLQGKSIIIPPKIVICYLLFFSFVLSIEILTLLSCLLLCRIHHVHQILVETMASALSISMKPVVLHVNVWDHF